MGLLRLLLANAVLFLHIGNFPLHKFINAGLAVNLFFVLSGYYMALVLNSKYKDDTKSFYINRFLRLWPVYLFSIFLVLLNLYLSHGLGNWIQNFLQLNLFAQVFVFLSNTFMFGSDLLLHFSSIGGKIFFSEFAISKSHNGMSFMLNPPVWTVSIELLLYFLSPFILKSYKKTIIFTLIGIIYGVIMRYEWFGFTSNYRFDLYYPYFFLLFGLGALAYWFPKKIKELTNLHYIFAAIFVLLVLDTYHSGIPSYPYIALAIAIPILFQLTSKNSIDRFLGELSYPLYLLHQPLNNLINTLMPDTILAIKYLIINLIVIITILYLEEPITKMRHSLYFNNLSFSLFRPEGIKKAYAYLRSYF